MQRALFFFQRLGVELSTFAVDMQQIFKVARKMAPGKGGNAAAAAEGGGGGDKAKETKAKDKENAGGQGKPSMKKMKKSDCLHLMCGMEVACFLAHKALMIEMGVSVNVLNWNCCVCLTNNQLTAWNICIGFSPGT